MLPLDYTLMFILIVIATLLFFLIRFLVRCLRRRRRDGGGRPERESKRPCWHVPPHIYRRPDPMIYSQQYLMKQGLAVTWDNPDIQLMENGMPVPSHALKPATTYQVVARIWNGSPDAPAVNMPVQFSYLDFGISTPKVFIGQTHVDLPVKGAPGHPAFATMNWTTPSTPGHYCLQVELLWFDDANPQNNLGQENTDVKPLNSPQASFTIPVYNPVDHRLRILLEGDSYQIIEQSPCENTRLAESNKLSREEIAALRRKAGTLHGRQLFPLPRDWQLRIEPKELLLNPGEEGKVQVAITAPDNFSGEQVFNLNAFSENHLLGGVTLKVTG